jgi:phosphatidylinositol alpha 1,6-mannosyltransferase
MNGWPRVAFFSDSFHGVDGVATTCRNVVDAARSQSLPFLAVHAGAKTSRSRDGSLEILELERGPLALELDKHLKFDLLFVRYYKQVLEAVRKFRADVVHITGPGDVGITGARVAHALGLPLVASWHTNLHTFAARRLSQVTLWLPDPQRRALTETTERYVLQACVRFYKIARVVMAPNREDINFLHCQTKKPVFPMRRGVDTLLFSPNKRDVTDRYFRIGFVGRLCPEKSVRFLAELERALCQEGFHSYRFLIVGDGGERPWLERNLQRADFTGELHGELLARAYANMDLFAFPSETDTYGNVVSEAMASGIVDDKSRKARAVSRSLPRLGGQQILELRSRGLASSLSSEFLPSVRKLCSTGARRKLSYRFWGLPELSGVFKFRITWNHQFG